jgi:hypothetical protein
VFPTMFPTMFFPPAAGFSGYSSQTWNAYNQYLNPYMTGAYGPLPQTPQTALGNHLGSVRIIP